jgi:phosphoribosylglycinamide formyltransferase-1
VTSRWAVFLSGRGSTAKAVMENCAQLDIRLIVSSRKSAFGLVQARRQGIPSLVLEKDVNWKHLHENLVARRVQKIFLLGFMKIIPAEFIQKWKGKIINVHPSLLPAFPGLEAMEKSFEQGKNMGVSVHVVTEEMDAGPLLLQNQVFSDVELQQSLNVMSFEQAQTRMAFCEQRLIRRASEVNGAFL